MVAAPPTVTPVIRNVEGPSVRVLPPSRSICTSNGSAFCCTVSCPSGWASGPSAAFAGASVTSAVPPNGGSGSTRLGSESSAVSAAAALVVPASTAGAEPQLSLKSSSTSHQSTPKLNEPMACHSPGPSSDMVTFTEQIRTPNALAATENCRLARKRKCGFRYSSTSMDSDPEMLAGPNLALSSTLYPPCSELDVMAK